MNPRLTRLSGLIRRTRAGLAGALRALWDRPPEVLEVVLLWAAGLALGVLAVRAALDLPPAGALAAWGAAVALGFAFVWLAEPVLWETEPETPPAPPPPPEPPPPPPVRPLFDLVDIAAGDFRMGSAPATEAEITAYARDWAAVYGGEVEKRADDLRRWLANEQPPHRVRLSPFAIARTPLTRAQWRAVLTETPKEWSDQADDGNLPATHIDWPQALTLCNALSARERLAPCYRRDEQGGWHWDRGAEGYRLPTEAEWEYACRAGTRTRWFWGEDPARAKVYAWYSGNSKGSLKPVGGKRKNPWGLHDMAGLVLEWCWDRYGAYPPETDPPPLDPVGPDEGDLRVVRGGSFAVPPEGLRPARRGGAQPDVRGGNLGLRCVRSRARQH